MCKGVCQATTVAVVSGTAGHDGSWQHTCTKFAAEEQQKLEEKAAEKQAEDEVENHVGEANKVQMVKEVSHAEQQHLADIESKRPCETTGGAANFTSDPGLQKSRESMIPCGSKPIRTISGVFGIN